MLVGELPQVGFSAGSFAANAAKGVTRPGHMALHIDLGSDPSRRISGMELEPDDIVAARGAVAFEYLARGHHLAASFNVPESVALSAMEWRAAGSSELRSGRLLRVTGAAHRVRTIRQVLSALVGDDAQAGALETLQTGEFASGSLLDAVVGALLGLWHHEHGAHVAVAHYQRMPIVRRAEEFMRANLGESIMLHHICAAARASERAVEYAFCDVYGMGAKQYLKLLRLHRVRRGLKEMPPQVQTIADIAQTFGFWHMGHFSTDYRRLFGETAQATRRQAWADVELRHDKYARFAAE
jgi:AraC family ethanolamine operon transcriptional activator